VAHISVPKRIHLIASIPTRGCPISRVLCEKWGPCSLITDSRGALSVAFLAMPKGLKRFYGNGDLHFITASCYHREPLLGTARRRNLFLRVLEQVREKYEFVVVGYVVMPEHFHLLISEPQKANPSVVVQALKLGVTRRLFSCSHKGRENRGTLRLFANLPPRHFWQRRFYDFNVWSARKCAKKLRYIHRNPVKRGLVEAPDQWSWSSFSNLRLWRRRNRGCK